jgi:hypothetical protein
VGWIGTNRQELVEVFADEFDAGQVLEAVARAKRKRDTRICDADCLALKKSARCFQRALRTRPRRGKK